MTRNGASEQEEVQKKIKGMRWNTWHLRTWMRFKWRVMRCPFNCCWTPSDIIFILVNHKIQINLPTFVYTSHPHHVSLNCSTLCRADSLAVSQFIFVEASSSSSHVFHLLNASFVRTANLWFCQQFRGTLSICLFRRNSSKLITIISRSIIRELGETLNLVLSI